LHAEEEGTEKEHDIEAQPPSDKENIEFVVQESTGKISFLQIS